MATDSSLKMPESMLAFKQALRSNVAGLLRRPGHAAEEARAIADLKSAQVQVIDHDDTALTGSAAPISVGTHESPGSLLRCRDNATSEFAPSSEGEPAILDWQGQYINKIRVQHQRDEIAKAEFIRNQTLLDDYAAALWTKITSALDSFAERANRELSAPVFTIETRQMTSDGGEYSMGYHREEKTRTVNLTLSIRSRRIVLIVSGNPAAVQQYDFLVDDASRIKLMSSGLPFGDHKIAQEFVETLTQADDLTIQ